MKHKLRSVNIEIITALWKIHLSTESRDYDVMARIGHVISIFIVGESFYKVCITISNEFKNCIFNISIKIRLFNPL